MELIIIFTASYLILISVAIYVYYIFYLSRHDIHRLRELVIMSIIAFTLSWTIAKTSGLIVHDPRPFVLEQVQPLVHVSTDNGFPSDHTLIAMAIGALVLVFNKKLGALLIFIAVLVGAGRVLSLAHHPLDVLGSIVIAAFSTLTAWVILQKRRIT